MAWCDRCCGTGYLDCYCGGDLCICANNGEYPCPNCDGDYDDEYAIDPDDREDAEA